jgi:hypothetical protein
MYATFTGTKSVFVIDDEPEAGRYALDAVPPKQPSWEKCREKFARYMLPETEGFFFSHNRNQGSNVAGFLAKSEEILELSDRSNYSHTEKDIILWVAPARFWMNCWVKRSFLTILLRCGMYYDPERDNYEEALFGNGTEADAAREYTNKTRLAVMRFMFGFTKFVAPAGVTEPAASETIHSKLWVEVFKDRSIKELKTILVSEKPTKGFGLLGTDAIWA